VSENQQQASTPKTEEKPAANASIPKVENKSAPDYPSATQRDQRTNSANFGENPDGEGIVTF
jgi:hypothetical protein